MRSFLIAALLAIPLSAGAQSTPLTAADSALIGRILLAEDRRDLADSALSQGVSHSDARIRTIALRARGRIADTAFTARDSLPTLPAPTVWPEPAWRLRYRALTARRNDCAALRTGLADSAWTVRLRAAALLPESCGTDSVIVTTLKNWVDRMPATTRRREPGQVSWHAGAHGIVALARLRPDDARIRLETLALHRQPEVRLYATRAAAVLADTVRLRLLVRDRDPNVKEAAIEALSRLTGHADDALFLEALNAHGAQVVRAAAIALKGSARSDVRGTADAAIDRWFGRANASERDARLALLELAGRPLTDDRPPVTKVELPPQAVALALGADVRVRVSLSASSGGGSFVVRLRGDVAPMMAARILELARRSYYAGLTWHRVEHDFVIQGGSPGSNEYVGYGQYLRDELGTVPHLRGTVGMSTRGHDTGDAQWFINLRDNLRLNRDYTVFGEVVQGMDVVDGIMEGDIIEFILLVPAATGL
jgi:cyclophilin family peptidyl-prolyl cis-trans isomerase